MFIVSVPDDRLGFDTEDQHFHRFTKESLERFLSKHAKVLRIEKVTVEYEKSKDEPLKQENKLLAVIEK